MTDRQAHAALRRPQIADDVELAVVTPSSSASRVWGFVQRAAANVFLGLIWFYKLFLSTPLHVLAGPQSGCRFHPSCSAYAAEAIRTHGPWSGLGLAVRRFLRCTPLSPGGVDFVPPRSALRPRCARAN